MVRKSDVVMVPKKRDLDNDAKRKIGENRAENLLHQHFGEVWRVPSPDLGTDLCGQRPHYSVLENAVPMRFQVKTGESYSAGVSVAANTLDRWLQRIEIEPVVILYYEDPLASWSEPDRFLIVYPWVLGHLPKIREALETSSRIWLPSSDFETVKDRNVDSLIRAMESEGTRAHQLAQGIFATNRHHFSEYMFLRYFPQVVRYWELPLVRPPALKMVRVTTIEQLILEASDGRGDVSQLVVGLLERPGHPLQRRSTREIMTAQARLYQALLDYGQGQQRVRLCKRFTTVEGATARSLATKYPNARQLAVHILTNWNSWPSKDDVLVALLMVGAQSHCNADDQSAVVKALRGMQAEVEAKVATLYQEPVTPNGLWTYRLAHHLYVVLAEVGEERYAKKAVQLAARYPLYELEHLRRYGWGMGQHVIRLYEQAAVNMSTIRSQKLQSYNRGMAAWMAEVVNA